MKVLIVDDEAIVCESLKLLLTIANFKVFTAPNQILALEIAKQETPDAAIVDWMLGGKPYGLQIAYELHDAVPGMRILLSSGNHYLKYEIPTGMPFQFLRKPYQLSELMLQLQDPDRTGT